MSQHYPEGVLHPKVAPGTLVKLSRVLMYLALQRWFTHCSGPCKCFAVVWYWWFGGVPLFVFIVFIVFVVLFVVAFVVLLSSLLSSSFCSCSCSCCVLVLVLVAVVVVVVVVVLVVDVVVVVVVVVVVIVVVVVVVASREKVRKPTETNVLNAISWTSPLYVHAASPVY